MGDTIHILWSEDGQHIRKWAQDPFEGSTPYIATPRARTPPQPSGGEEAVSDAVHKALWEADAEVKRLREALEPFADALGDDDADEPDHTSATLVCGRSCDYSLDLGDFRAARAALVKTGEGGR